MKKFLDTCRRLLSIALNLFVLCAEPIALPLSWEMGQAQIFTFYTEDSNIFAAAVCTLVALWQLRCIFTGGELPRWLKRLKFMATSCLLLTFLTVVFVLAPMNGEGGLYMLLCTSSMLYHHLLNPMGSAPLLPAAGAGTPPAAQRCALGAAAHAGICGGHPAAEHPAGHRGAVPLL